MPRHRVSWGCVIKEIVENGRGGMCVLRAWGKNFDVDRFLKRSPWKPCAIFRRGEKRGILGNKKNAESSFNLGVSEASWLDLAAQVRDATKFIQKHKSELRRLKRFPGVEGVVLDFPVEDRMSENKMTYTIQIPEAFIQVAGGAGLSIEVSIYVPSRRSKKSSKSP